jgi:DNA mismatch repair protein PMS2
MFPLMHIIGQFNLGFIIAYLDGDLYILDQHACDEKYRFESLQRTTQIHQQPLIHPLTVETSPALEVIITENLELFSSNGFKLRVDAEQSTGKRIQLLSVPFSKSIHFGVDDVNELASMISDSGDQYDNDEAITQRTNKAYLGLKNDIIHPDKSGPSSVDKGTNKSINIRIPKLVAMYASRACRSAIMIGTCLKTPDMRSIVDRLQHVDQPWNCPHGRPTIRHLADISQLTDSRPPC